MKITPIDIRQQQFGRTLRGLDAREVDSFLNLVSDELETNLKENNRLREELARMNRLTDEYRGREQALKETMITAQKITVDIKETARKEAEVIISRAEIQAEKIIYAANDRLVKIIEDINEIKRQREQMHANLVNVVKAHRRLLLEIDEEKSEALFVSIEDIKKRKALLHAQIKEAIEAQGNLLNLDRDRELEDLREEVERLQNLRVNMSSKLDSILSTHTKMLQVREEAEGKESSFKVENNLKVLIRPQTQQAQKEITEEQKEEPLVLEKELENS